MLMGPEVVLWTFRAVECGLKLPIPNPSSILAVVGSLSPRELRLPNVDPPTVPSQSIPP